MSLVYDALRRLDPQQAGQALDAPAAASVGRSWPMRNILAVIVLGVLSAPAAFLLARSTGAEASTAAMATSDLAAEGTGETATPMRARSVAMATTADPDVDAPSRPVTANPDTGGLRPPVATAPVPAAITATAQVATARPAPAAALPTSLDAQPDAQNDTTLAGSNIHIKIGSRDVANGKEAAGATDAAAASIGQTIAELEAAQARHDHEAASAGLARLGRLLPADSLTLLRMRAWLAHDTGDLVEAERLYQLIVGRVPNDRNASINLALLQAGRGETVQARTRLDQFTLTNGDSPELARVKSQLKGDRR